VSCFISGPGLGPGLGTTGLDYKTANNADITQSQAANHHQLFNHVTLVHAECRK